MQRRQLLTGAAGATIAAAIMPKPAISRNAQQLKLALAWPKKFPGLGTSSERLARSISLATDSRVDVVTLDPSEIDIEGSLIDAVGSGKADMYHAVEYYWEKKSRAFNFFASVPFGMTALEQEAWLSNMGGQKLWDELSAKYNIKPLAVGNTGVQMGGWFNRVINTPADIKGLKLRMPGIGGDVYKRLGAELIDLPSAVVPRALKDQKIDATEWLGPWPDMEMGFHKVARLYYWPGFHEPGTQISLGINLDVWKSFSDSERKIIEITSRTESQRLLAKFNAENSQAISKIKKSGTVKLAEFPPLVLNSLGQVSGDVVREVAKEGALEQRIYESFIRARWQLLQWAKFSDEAYLLARRLPFSYRRSVTFRGPRKKQVKKVKKAVSSKSQVSKNIPQFEVKVTPNVGVSKPETFNPFRK